MLGVAVIAAVGSVAASVRGGIAANAREILGGDVELRLLYQPAKPEQLAFFAASSTFSASQEMRAMSRPAAGDERALVELKAVDAAYPRYGSVALQPAMPLADALAQRDGRWGAAVDPNLLERLGLKVGDSLRVGDADFQIRATILREPDRGAGIFILGPRLLVADGSLAATGLVQQGSLVYYVYRIRLPANTNAAAWIDQLKAQFPDAVWRIRGLDDAAAGIRQFIDRTAMFLVLVGLRAISFRYGIVYAIGGGHTSLAVRGGGRGDVTKTHTLWRHNGGSNVSSPVYHDRHLYWASDDSGVVFCQKADTGKVVYQKRLAPPSRLIYASCLLAGGKLWVVSTDGSLVSVDARSGQIASTTPLGTKVFVSPVVAGGRMYILADNATLIALN